MRAPCSHRADRSPLCPIPRAALQPDPQGLPTPPPSGHLGATRRRHGVHAHQPHGCHQSSGSGTAATAAHSIHAQHFGPGALPRGCSSVLRLQRCCRGRRGFKKPIRHCLGGGGVCCPPPPMRCVPRGRLVAVSNPSSGSVMGLLLLCAASGPIEEKRLTGAVSTASPRGRCVWPTPRPFINTQPGGQVMVEQRMGSSWLQ